MEKNNALVSEFAFITAVSFLYFYEKQCDIVVLEEYSTENGYDENSLNKNAVLCVTAAQPFHIRTMM